MMLQVENTSPAPVQNLFLAYDGSINTDWVSRYAIRMAVHSEIKTLNLVHILDGTFPAEKVRQKIEAIQRECTAIGVHLDWNIYPCTRNVFKTLREIIVRQDNSLCICGTRVRSGEKGFLAGTVSEQLLRCKGFDVMAFRVVQPGLLGIPKELLFPLSGHPRGFRAAMPFFLLLAPDTVRLHILRIMQVSSFWFQYMPEVRVKALRRQGTDYVKNVLAEIAVHIDESRIMTDYRVVLSDDWAKEILIHASRLHARLILLGATDRILPSRFFYGNKLEQILRGTPCDVCIYRKI